jgi:hypothetical protein
MLLVALAVLAAAHSRAAEAPRWILSAEAGGTRIHSDDRSQAGALRLQREIGSRGIVRAQLGLAVAAYQALDAGLELHPWPRARVSPFVGAGGGYMVEDEFEGGFLRGTAGLEARLSARGALRLAVQAGTHDGDAGPHLLTIGIGWRF